jgi:hypothetical protein
MENPKPKNVFLSKSLPKWKAFLLMGIIQRLLKSNVSPLLKT